MSRYRVLVQHKVDEVVFAQFAPTWSRGAYRVQSPFVGHYLYVGPPAAVDADAYKFSSRIAAEMAARLAADIFPAGDAVVFINDDNHGDGDSDDDDSDGDDSGE